MLLDAIVAKICPPVRREKIRNTLVLYENSRRPQYSLRALVLNRSRLIFWSCLTPSNIEDAVPRGPQGQKRPADTVANAIRVAKILTGSRRIRAIRAKTKPSRTVARQEGWGRAAGQADAGAKGRDSGRCGCKTVGKQHSVHFAVALVHFLLHE